MPKIRLPNGKYLKYDGSPPSADELDDVMNQIESASSPLSIAKDSMKSFGRGFESGATFGTMGEEPLAGSVFEPHPIARKIGQFLGTGIPITAAAATGGAALGIGAETAGASALGSAMLEGAGTGMTFEAMKGAVQNKSPMETLSKIPQTGMEFAGIGAIGKGLGYLRELFGERGSEYLANHFINSEKSVSMKFREQGKPSLGEQFLKTDLPGFKNRNEVYEQAGKELGNLEGQVKQKLSNSPSDKVIKTREIADSLDKLQESYKTGTRRGEIVKISTKKGNFLEDNPESLTVEEAMQLKRKLDDKVSKAYLNPESQRTPLVTEVDEHLANSLRSKLYEIDPELGNLAAKESLMIRIRSGLLKTPTVSKYGGSGLPHGFWSAMVNMAESSPASNLAAKGLEKTMGTPSRFIAPIAKRASQVGITMPPGFYSDENQ